MVHVTLRNAQESLFLFWSSRFAGPAITAGGPNDTSLGPWEARCECLVG